MEPEDEVYERDEPREMNDNTDSELIINWIARDRPFAVFLVTNNYVTVKSLCIALLWWTIKAVRGIEIKTYYDPDSSIYVWNK